MTLRPRIWTFYGASHQAVAPGEYVRVVEWDRDRTVPAIRAALGAFQPTGWQQMDRDIAELRAEAIFDALDKGDGV